MEFLLGYLAFSGGCLACSGVCALGLSKKIKNERGNRAKSAAISAYESTPLSYANKGKEIEIRKGQIFVMSFKAKDEPEENIENKPNYSYEIINE